MIHQKKRKNTQKIFTCTNATVFIITFKPRKSSVTNLTLRAYYSYITLSTWRGREQLNQTSHLYQAMFNISIKRTLFCEVQLGQDSYQGNQERPVVPSHPLVHYNQVIQTHPKKHICFKVLNLFSPPLRSFRYQVAF